MGKNSKNKKGNFAQYDDGDEQVFTHSKKKNKFNKGDAEEFQNEYAMEFELSKEKATKRYKNKKKYKDKYNDDYYDGWN